MPHRQTIEEKTEAARQRIERYSPVEAAAAQRAGAVLVDTRDSSDRVAEGVIPDSVSVLECPSNHRYRGTAQVTACVDGQPLWRE